MRAFGRGKGNQVRCLSDPVTVSRKVCPEGHCVMYVRRRADEGASGNERDRQAGSCEPGNLLFCSGWTGFREKQFREESIIKEGSVVDRSLF